MVTCCWKDEGGCIGHCSTASVRVGHGSSFLNPILSNPSKRGGWIVLLAVFVQYNIRYSIIFVFSLYCCFAVGWFLVLLLSFSLTLFPLSFSRQQYEIDVCLEDNREELLELPLSIYICTIIIGSSY